MKYRKDTWQFVILYLLMIVPVSCLLTGCRHCDVGEGTETIVETAQTEAPAEAFLLDIAVLENREGELVFDISLDDFIESYNSFYEIDYGCSFFTSESQWRCYTYDTGIHSSYETRIHYFSEDEHVHSLPTISVYVPTNTDYIQLITVNFDEHSYTETTYEMYEQMCFYTMKVFFPELSDEQITGLCTEVMSFGDLNIFSSEEWYGFGAVPCGLFYKDGAGVYPYYAIGDWDRVCIIPLTADAAADLKQKGAEIHEIE